MADKKISDLTAASGVNYTDTVPIVQTGSTKKILMSIFALRWGGSKWDANASKIGSVANGELDDDAAAFGQVRSVQYMPNRTVLINGGMQVDQRNAGASQTITAAAALAYTVDRWWAACTGANVTGQQTAITGFPAPFKRAYQFTGLASNTGVQFGQRMEMINTYHLAGQSVVLSAYMKASTSKTVTWTAYRANTDDTFGTLASPSKTQIATGTWSVTTTPTRFNATFTGPSETDSHGIEIVFSVPTLLGSETWAITGVQLELGTVPTVFELRSFQQELALAQRYWQLHGGDGRGSLSCTQYGLIGGGMTMAFRFPVAMRANPTVTKFGTWTVSNSGQPTVLYSNFQGFTLFSVPSATQVITWNDSSASHYVTADAEL